jgi:hypothetical protein
MNRKQLVILFGLVLVVGGAALLQIKKRSASWENTSPVLGKKLLGNFPVNDVAHIEIRQGSNDLNLVKKDDLWRVRERNDYPANYNDISDFLLKARDLKIVQSEKVGPSQLPRLALVTGQGTNSALVVDFKDQSDKPIKSLLLGKKHMKKSDRPSPMGEMGGDEGGWPDGRYVKASAESDSVVLISDALANIEPKPEQWLNKDFFKIEKPKSISVTFATETNSWKLTRETETGEWKLVDAKPAEQLDSSKVSSVSNPFSSPSFADVATLDKSESFGFGKPTAVTVDTFDNFTYVIKIGQKTNDNVPLSLTVSAQIPRERGAGKDEKPEDKTKLDKEFQEKEKKLEEKLNQEKSYEKWLYLVSTWTVDPLLKERSQLLVEKKEEPKKDTAKKDEQPTVAPDAPKKEDPGPAPLPAPPADSKP